MQKQEILNKYGQPQKVGHDGHVRLVDYMGDDAAVVQAARVSYGAGTKTVRDDEKLIRYLMRHRHTTPFEMVIFKFHVRVPMDTWRQWIRHRTASVNEYSTRYSEAIDSRELTRVEEWRLQSKNNKQGSAGTVLEADYSDHDTLTSGAEVADYLSQREMELHELSRLVYNERLEAGVAREQARKDLPLSTYTEAYWEMNLHNLLHFLRLRMHPHAQQEIREFAQAIYEIVKEVVPITAKAFEDYQLNGCFFTSEELDCLAEIINMAIYVNPKTGAQKNILELDNEERKEFLEQFISTKRERIEFWNKLKC